MIVITPVGYLLGKSSWADEVEKEIYLQIATLVLISNMCSY